MRVSLEDIKKVVCNHYNLDEKLLFSKNRKRNIIITRQAFIYLAYNINYELGFHDLGRYMGLDHSTLVYSNKKVEGFMDVDRYYRQEIKDMWVSCLDSIIPEEQIKINRVLVQNLTDKLLHCKSNTELKEILTSTLEKL